MLPVRPCHHHGPFSRLLCVEGHDAVRRPSRPNTGRRPRRGEGEAITAAPEQHGGGQGRGDSCPHPPLP
ncbi:hypothetical protein THAOC_04329 [Thalassiosira oceanica]|uniref:Uncharacterized protein n=1 Tax=Thalassiosira oceanica TaxID=159749 RepID=K0TJB9_THAOC|nr:hypothetical protein THAOC_04329 [Thalassiosira oceanica]|eukprot:EJK74021.1 hypothetical protein THAOC_04329 [Thalassiosira oceanica]